MNCNELLDCIGQVQDSYIAGSVPAEKPRRKIRRAVYWAAAAVLAVVLCVAGVALFSGGTPVDPNGPMAGIDPAVTDTGATDPDPIVSEYDVFSDPNVLWGSGEEKMIDSSLIYGKAVFSSGMYELLEMATAENLIAFYIYFGAEYRNGWCELNLDQLVIHEELDQGGRLTDLIKEYNAAEEVDRSKKASEISQYLRSFYNEHLSQTEERMIRIERRLEEELAAEGLTDWVHIAYHTELKSRLFGDEEFRELFYGDFLHYAKILAEFEMSYYIQRYSSTRELFSERGFIPVYDLEELSVEDYLTYMEDPNSRWGWYGFRILSGASDVSGYTRRQALTFVGSADLLNQLEEVMGEEEAYFIVSATETLTVMDA